MKFGEIYVGRIKRIGESLSYCSGLDTSLKILLIFQYVVMFLKCHYKSLFNKYCGGAIRISLQARNTMLKL